MKKTSKKSSKKVESVILQSNFLSIVSGIALGFALVFLMVSVDIISGMLPEKKETSPKKEEFVEIIEPGEEKTAVETLNELRGVNDLSSVLKGWASNTSENTLMKSENVINILLIGLDEMKSNSDAIIIASLNKTDKKIYLHSIYRDSYTYISTKFCDKYAKINACYANGGAEKLTETVENNFKIDIDYYVSVNFDSFSTIVNSFGGISLDVKEYEAKEIEKVTERYCPYGNGVLLDGEQALTFCRIRNCDADADISRTRRQRQFINALIDEAGSIGISQVSPLLNAMIKYINTDCGFTDLISLGMQAVSEKWYNYEIISDAIPKEEHRLDYRGNAWVWIVDYPLCATDLQNTVYGSTNINLQSDRVSAIDIMRNADNTVSAAP